MHMLLRHTSLLVLQSPTVKRTPPAPPASPPPGPREIKLAVANMDAQKRVATQAAAIRRIASCKASAVQDLKGDLLSHLLPQLEVLLHSSSIPYT